MISVSRGHGLTNVSCFCQVRGTKNVSFLAPDQSDRLYPTEVVCARILSLSLSLSLSLTHTHTPLMGRAVLTWG
eukprot:SAG25_NODE_5789_length_620_cov_1.385797_1_plen_73_part_10